MSKILLTGSTGFIGSKVLEQMILQKKSVKLFLRDKSKLLPQFQDCEICIGDIRDKKQIKNALKDCNEVIHIAGMISLYPKDEKLLHEINYEGAVNVFQASLEEGIDKLVYTGSSSCLDAYTTADKKSKIESSEMKVPYIQSKTKALEEALHYAEEGLPIVILCPTLVLGEGDYNLTSSELIYRFLRKEIPAYLDGGFNPVYVEDIAKAHLKALELGETGEVYVLAGKNNLTVKEFFSHLERLSGIKAPKRKIPFWIAQASAYINELFSKEPLVNSSAVRMGNLYWYFDSGKMTRELEIEPTSLEITLKRSIEWIQNEILKKEK